MSGRPTYFEAGPGEKFCIIAGDDWLFDIVPERNAHPEDLRFGTRLAALESHLHGLEQERADLSRAISRAKRLRRAWLRTPPPGDRNDP